MGEAAASVYLILKGEIELLLEDSAIGFRAGGGSLIGIPAAYSKEPHSLTATASSDLEVAVMKRDHFCQMVASKPSFSLDVLTILAAETRAARIALRTLG
jgi:CRP-like cAMP-binding protein